MAYADIDYYQTDFQGQAIPEQDIARQLDRASDDVDVLTYNRIRAMGFDNLTPYQQERVKKANCAQAEFLYTCGDFANLPLTGFSAGSVSVSLGDKVNGVTASPETLRLLGQTGLSSRRL